VETLQFLNFRVFEVLKGAKNLAKWWDLPPTVGEDGAI
jgi:hypothetical protein